MGLSDTMLSTHSYETLMGVLACPRGPTNRTANATKSRIDGLAIDLIYLAGWISMWELRGQILKVPRLL